MRKAQLARLGVELVKYYVDTQGGPTWGIEVRLDDRVIAYVETYGHTGAGEPRRYYVVRQKATKQRRGRGVSGFDPRGYKLQRLALAAIFARRAMVL